MASVESEALSREQQREYLRQMRQTYQEIERQRLSKPWAEPSEDEKIRFDRLMADANRHRKGSRDCGLVEWYKTLIRKRA